MKESYDICRKVNLILLLTGLPLIGIVGAGRPLAVYCEFPPLTRYVQHAGFSWFVFISLAVLILAVVMPFIFRVLRSARRTPASPQPTPNPSEEGNLVIETTSEEGNLVIEATAEEGNSLKAGRLEDTLLRRVGRAKRDRGGSPALLPPLLPTQSSEAPLHRPSSINHSPFNHRPSSIPHRPFPKWGWAGLTLTAVAWAIAWTRIPLFAPLQTHMFTPLWIGYVIVVNALTYKRTGRCMLRDRPGYVMGLFMISAGFWWYFEYLNRFAQNWHYLGISDLSRFQYFIFATLPFSTVLPAALGTRELLESAPSISAGLEDFIKIRIPRPGMAARAALAVFSVGLAAIGVWPDCLFPLLWVAPLFIITSAQAIRGEKTIFAAIETGDWRNIFLLALSALICGFFWEMWNYHSFAKWIYAVPHVNRFKIFEMPVLGYAGYLPFGLECAVVAEFFLKKCDNVYR